MVPTKSDWSQSYPHAVLRGVLADAAKTIPEAKRTPSLMACLAERILASAADGQENPINLGRRAIEKVRESCPDCHACHGLQVACNNDRSQEKP
ncbi:hypothetical protein ABH994_006863 [Bradyrhizobium yuanmingense]